VVTVLVIAILSAGDQQVIREPGAHNWPSYPVGLGGYYVDYASAAAFIARQARAGDGIVYQAREHQDSWLMVGYGLQYYLARDMPNGGAGSARALHRAHRGRGRHPVPGALRAASGLPGCRTEDLGHRRRPPDEPLPGRDPSQAAVLRPRYRLSLVKHQRSLTMFLLTRHE
jgi:hypothetical protein